MLQYISSFTCLPLLQFSRFRNETDYQSFIHLRSINFTFITFRYRYHFAKDSFIPNLELRRFEMDLSLPRQVEVHWLRLVGLLLSYLLVSHHLHLQMAARSLLGDFLWDPLACLVSQISGL
jgi:hypothetical protein